MMNNLLYLNFGFKSVKEVGKWNLKVEKAHSSWVVNQVVLQLGFKV